MSSEPSPLAPAVFPPPLTPAPPAPGSGPLRNGNPRGNPHASPRCGARTRAGEPCRQPALANGRCRLHGGKSTGARTEAGKAAARAAATTHGYWTEESRAFRHTINALLARGRALNRALAPPAGKPRPPR
jgi:hypothetical protein